MTETEDSKYSHEAAVGEVRRSHSALEEAQQQLHHVLGTAIPGREEPWARDVGQRLETVRLLLARHRNDIQADTGLYGELRYEAPWLLGRLDQLVAKLQEAESHVAALASRLHRVQSGDHSEVDLVRDDGERLARIVRGLMAQETDIIWERFRETVALD